MSTISGGGATTPVPLSAAQLAAAESAIQAVISAQESTGSLSSSAQAALNNIMAGHAGGNAQILTYIPRGGAVGFFTVYEINNPTTSPYTLVSGTQGAILEGSTSTTLNGRAQNELLIGNSGNDTLNGAGGNGTIIGGDGNNVISTGAGATGFLILTGTGNDTITLSSGNDTVTTNGNATVTAGTGNASLSAGAGNDSFIGGTGTNTFYAGTGNDTFVGNAGASHDTFVFDHSVDAGGQITVSGYDTTSGHSTVILTGSTTVDSSTFTSGNTVVSLHDGTQITFLGVDIHTQF